MFLVAMAPTPLLAQEAGRAGQPPEKKEKPPKLKYNLSDKLKLCARERH